ncbi:MAG: hypothetical protein K2N92_00655 [Malacoplasma sp.]|nr:hypothetical protein [Malacoplasma sp.]MDE5841500.1 hypothetical protein [Malacoplasma sp.]MDE6082494.1 hypothetical protein [Malacoplasma sp.]MDE7112087.1 hypothetical protein [Malacoplasma sp.]
MEIGNWVSLGIILFAMLVSLIVEIAMPAAFGITTIVSLIPSAFIAGFVQFQWWLPIVEIGVAIILWIFIYFMMFKVLKIKRISKNKTDYLDKLKDTVTVLTKSTSNYNGKNVFGEIKIDDKTYLVLPIDEQTTINLNTTVKIIDIKGSICYIREI